MNTPSLVRPQFVFFDLGNVLVRFDPQRACRNLAELANCSPGKVQAIVYDSGLQWRYEAGEVTCADFAATLNQELGLELPGDTVLASLADMFFAETGTFSVIAKLIAAEIPVGLLSNTCAAHWGHIRVTMSMRILDLLSPLVVSFEEKCIKPHPQIYRQAAAKAGVAPELIAFTDDREENVAAAQQAGWRCHLYQNPQGLTRWLSEQGLPVFV